jgi:hypothetical protein
MYVHAKQDGGGVGTKQMSGTNLAKSWKSDAHCCWRRGVRGAARLQMVAMEAKKEWEEGIWRED